MAVDIYEAGVRRLSVPAGVLHALERAQEELKLQTGRYIDAYGTASIEPEHATLWLVGLKRIQPSLEKSGQARQACDALIAVLQDAVERRLTLVFEGD